MVEEVPELRPSAGDHVHTAAKAVVSSIPIVGGAAGALFETLITAPLQRRRDDWIEYLALGLDGVLDRIADLEKVANDEHFLDVALEASTSALKTSSADKRAALRNAVLNAAVGRLPADSKTPLFVAWIGELSEWHLALVRYFHNPAGFFAARHEPPPEFYSASRAAALEKAFPNLDRGVYDQLIRDLHNRGLLITDSVHALVSGGAVLDRLLSPLGTEFLEFISRPPGT
ncbi:MAG: hypothetical protein AB7N24_17330 [Dehalococcoidia bacterium]